jgi:hypothetical protein
MCLSNLDLKLLMVSRARWSGVRSGHGGRMHREIIESKHVKIYLGKPGGTRSGWPAHIG